MFSPDRLGSLSFIIIVAFIQLSVPHPNPNPNRPTDQQLQQSAELCCPGVEKRACCLERMRQDNVIQCGGGTEDDLSMSVCLEQSIYPSHQSNIQERPFECCWLLGGIKCREHCSNNFRKPSLPLIERLSYSDHCTPEPTTAPLNGSCLHETLKIWRSCFTVCITWTRKRVNNSTGEQGGTGGTVGTPPESFHPSKHCPAFMSYVEQTLCNFVFD